MVSVRLPSAFSTVVSVVQKSAVVSPLSSVLTTLDRPLALVLAITVLSSGPPGCE